MQIRFVSLHSSSIRHHLLDISETLTPPNPSYPCAIHSTIYNTEATRNLRRHRRAASGKTPPPCSIGQDATAAQHRARSHRRAASGKKPPAAQHRARSHRRAASGRKPPPRRLLPAASQPPTHDFHVHPLFLPSTHTKFEFQLFVSTLDWPVGSESLNISPRAGTALGIFKLSLGLGPRLRRATRIQWQPFLESAAAHRPAGAR